MSSTHPLIRLMQRAGRLAPDEVERIEHHRATHGGSCTEAVLAVTEFEETNLAEFLASKLAIPRIDVDVLTMIEPQVFARIPAELAWRLGVAVVSCDDLGNLTLAMEDPTDTAAVDAVHAETGLRVIRAVAEWSALRATLEHRYGSRPQPPMPDPMPDPMPAANATVNTATANPMLATAWAATKPAVLAASDRAQMTEALLEFGARVFERTILLVHLRGRFRGHAGCGPDLLADAVSRIEIPTTLPSVFARVVAQGRPFVGCWPTEHPVDRAFSQALGQLEGESVVVPFRLRDKTPILLFGSGATEPFAADVFEDMSRSVEQALAQLLMVRRRVGAAM